MEKSREERLEEFLIELENLYLKHGFIVSSCECCNSPWITSVDDGIYEPKPPEEVVRETIDHLRNA